MVRAGKQEAETMKDKSLNITLISIFGISGIAMLMLAWLQPMPGSERGMTFLIGSIGLLMALIRALMLKTQRIQTETRTVTVEVESGNR